jgi:hypothetical protein
MQRTTVFCVVFAAACAGSPRTRAAAPDPHAQAVSQLVGRWEGKALGTPFGDFPFAIAFDREPGGDVHGRLDGGGGMYLDFRFHREAGAWRLIQSGQIPGVGARTSTLLPVGDTQWVVHAPKNLAVDLDVDATTLVMTTTLDGKKHAVFQLARAK